jgi:hypothetical protein
MTSLPRPSRGRAVSDPAAPVPGTPRSITPTPHLRRHTPGAPSVPTPGTPHPRTPHPHPSRRTPGALQVDGELGRLVRRVGGLRDRIAASSWANRPDPLDRADSSRKAEPMVVPPLLGSRLRVLNRIEGEVSRTLAELCRIEGEVSAAKATVEAQIGVR